jgi:hypothetical protein
LLDVASLCSVIVFFPLWVAVDFFLGNVESNLWRWQVWNMLLLKWGLSQQAMLQSVSAEGFQKDTVCNSIPVGSTVHHLFHFFLEFAEDDLICLAYFPNGNSTPWGIGLGIGGTP